MRCFWYVLTALRLLLSALTRQPVAFFAAGFTLVLAVLPEVWDRLALHHLRVAGGRTWQWGDEPRRIHWKATARTGLFQSKQHEPATQHLLFLFLNCQTFLESWLGIDPELHELTISAAASSHTGRWREATWSGLLRIALRRQGMAAQLAFAGEREQSLPTLTGTFPVHWLDGKEVWHELLQACVHPHDPAETTAHFYLD